MTVVNAAAVTSPANKTPTVDGGVHKAVVALIENCPEGQVREQYDSAEDGVLRRAKPLPRGRLSLSAKLFLHFPLKRCGHKYADEREDEAFAGCVKVVQHSHRADDPEETNDRHRDHPRLLKVAGAAAIITLL